MKKSWIYILVIFFISAPFSAAALTMSEIMPQNQEVKGVQTSAGAASYIVIDRQTGQVLLSKNPDLKWPPASLTKLVTALVFLESKTSLEKVVAMKKEDEVGGQRLVTKSGVKYKTRDLFHAALIASDNNAAHALARSVGLTEDRFVALMNKKVKELGANNTQFFETTGMNPKNYTTASDFAKITVAALYDPYLSLVVKKQTYSFASVNNKRYSHTIKTTNKLLSDGQISVIGGKTGYLDESLYNFTTISKDGLGNEFVIVVLGAPNPTEQFNQTKELAFSATAKKVFGNFTAVLGISTTTQAALAPN